MVGQEPVITSMADCESMTDGLTISILGGNQFPPFLDPIPGLQEEGAAPPLPREQFLIIDISSD